MRIVLLIIILTFLCGQTFSQDKDSISNTLSEELEIINLQGHIIGFSVAIVNERTTLYTRGFGFADAKDKIQYTENSIQNIASISKTFIGVALLKAQELGLLSLDDPINKYLPFEVSNPYFENELISIRHLATHTSSIRDPARYEKNGYILKDESSSRAKENRNFLSPDKMMAQNVFLENILSKEGKWYKKNTFLNNLPGEFFEYSNVAAGLTALILENATEESFTEFTKKHIFDPLEMDDTGWSFEDVDFSKHTKLYRDKKTELAHYHLVNYPDGGLITSSFDLSKYLRVLIAGFSGNGKVLNADSYRELFTPQLSEENFKERNEGTYNDEYNIGVFMGMSAKGQIGHTGGDPGVVTHMFFNTETRIGKILIVNTNLKKEGIQEFIDIWHKLEEYENEL